MEEKQFELLQVCAEGHLSASETSHVTPDLSSRLPLLATQGSLVFRDVLMVTNHRVDKYKCQRCKSTD